MFGNFAFKKLNQFGLVVMVNVRNIQRKNAFLHVRLCKPLGKLVSLLFFHDGNNISPRKLFFGNRVFIVKPGRFGFKPVSEQLFRSFAAVLVLVADEQHFHSSTLCIVQYKPY